MLDDSLYTSRTLQCFIHKKERATHICTDLYCHANPIICSSCIGDPKYRNIHASHESSIRGVSQGVDFMAGIIRTQVKNVENIYERTIGHKDNDLIRSNLQKGHFLNQELENRIDNLRVQVDLEIQMLFKEFQKQILLQKQDFIKKLQEYRRVFFSNLESIKKECTELISFQTSLRFYNNPNNLLLKLVNQTQRKSLQWFIQQKKTLLKVTNLLQNPQFSNNLLQNLNKANKMNMMSFPFWKGERKETDNQLYLRQWIRGNLNNWIQIPQLTQLERLQEFGSYRPLPSYYPN